MTSAVSLLSSFAGLILNSEIFSVYPMEQHDVVMLVLEITR